MATPASGAEGWLTFNGHSISFAPGEENLQVAAKEGERNLIRITGGAPDDIEIWVHDERLETERYGSWYWRPKGFAGRYRFTVRAPSREPQSTYIRVLPKRLSLARYEWMLADIQVIAEDLLFQLRSPATEALAPRDQRYSSSALREYQLIKAVFPELADAVSHIRRNPNSRLRVESTAKLLHEVRRFSAEVVPIPGPFVSLSSTGPRRPTPWLLPQVWSVEEHTITYDTHENGLLKHFLWRQLLPRLVAIQEKAEAEIRKRKESQRFKQLQGWEDDEADRIQNLHEIVTECHSLLIQCIAWGSETFLKDVQISGGRPQSSQVLQKDPHYNRFFRVFLRFQAELSLNLDSDRYVAELAMRKLSEIYEIWAVFTVANAAMILMRRSGYQVLSSNGFFAVRDDLFQFEVDRDAAIELIKGSRRIRIRYEPIYEVAARVNAGVVSRGQKRRTPDLSIEVTELDRTRAVLIFDAKYRSEKVGANETYLDEDLDKMRAYRDMIAWKAGAGASLQSIVKSAYILYPGDIIEHDPDSMGVGALPLLPDMETRRSSEVSVALSQILRQAFSD